MNECTAPLPATLWTHLESVPVPVLVVGKDGLIRFTNRLALDLFGYAGSDDLLRQPVERLLPERFRQAHINHRADYSAKSSTRPMGGVRQVFGRRKDGSEFRADVRLAPSEGYVTVSVRDMAEREQSALTIAGAGEDRGPRRAGPEPQPGWSRVVVAMAVIALASALRVWPLHSLGARVAWLTFYPAVVIASLYGGLAAGLLGIALSCFAVLVVLPGAVGQPLVRDSADYLGMGVFVATCAMLSGLSEAMHRARRRAAHANQQFQALNRELEGEVLRRREVEAETRLLNEKLERGVAELAATNRELESFSYSIAHDLRAPLRSLDGFSQALLEDYTDKLDADGKKYLSYVRESAQQMAQLIDDLLALSRVTRSELHSERVDLSALVAGAVARLNRSHPEREVGVMIQEGLAVEGDPRLLTVALDNLLGNAWKFTARSEHARVEFGATSRDGLPVYFVRDNGAGFDMAFVSKLFGVFQRLHSAAEFEGTGVGLATVQRIVGRHGGRVWAEGEPNHGATFHFTLHERGR